VVGWVPLADPKGTAQALDQLPSRGKLVGIRHLVFNEPDPNWLTQPAVLESLKLLAKAGLAFDSIPVTPPQFDAMLETARRLPMHRRARLGLGYLPQEPSVFRKLSVEDNIMAVLEALPNLSPAARAQRVKALLEEFGLVHKRKALGISLSGGERRRVEIARALSLTPSFILLDEPFAGIDPISVGDIQKVISFLRNKGIGVLITDHNVRETLGICDRAYILAEGRVLAAGSPDEVLNHPEVRSTYLGHQFRL